MSGGGRRRGTGLRIPSLSRIANYPRHYHSHIDEGKAVSISAVYNVNMKIDRKLHEKMQFVTTASRQTIFSKPPLFHPGRCQTRLISSYAIEKQIGQGAYGKVFKGIDLHSNHVVAIKQMEKRKERNGFSQNALREIKLLRQIYHRNSINLLQIVVGDDTNNLDDIRKNPMYLIYEYIDHDLAGVLKRKEEAAARRGAVLHASTAPSPFVSPCKKHHAPRFKTFKHTSNKRKHHQALRLWLGT